MRGLSPVSGTGIEIAYFSGPLPPPPILKHYDQVVPGLARELVDMVHKESDHRRSLEKKQIDAEIRDQLAERAERKRGQWMGFGIALSALAVTVVAILAGYPLEGTFLGGGTLASLVAVFIIGRYFESREPEKKHGDYSQGRL